MLIATCAKNNRTAAATDRLSLGAGQPPPRVHPRPVRVWRRRGCGMARAGHRDTGAQMEEGVAIDVEGYPTAGCDEHRYRATRPLVSRRQFPRPGSGAAQSPDDAGEPAAFGCVAVTRAPQRHSPPGGDRDVSRREAVVADQAGHGNHGDTARTRCKGVYLRDGCPDRHRVASLTEIM